MVPGFARFHQEAKGDAVRGGQLLLGELNCIRCHVPASGRDSISGAKSAPILDQVGARVKRAYLREFLSDPHACKPGTTMPNVLAGMSEADKKAKVEALVHYLASTANPKPDRADLKAVSRGRDLYHQVGCVACHGTRMPRGIRTSCLLPRWLRESQGEIHARQPQDLPGKPPPGPPVRTHARPVEHEGGDGGRQLSHARNRCSRLSPGEHGLHLLRRRLEKTPGLQRKPSPGRPAWPPISISRSHAASMTAP